MTFVDLGADKGPRQGMRLETVLGITFVALLVAIGGTFAGAHYLIEK